MTGQKSEYTVFPSSSIILLHLTACSRILHHFAGLFTHFPASSSTFPQYDSFSLIFPHVQSPQSPASSTILTQVPAPDVVNMWEDAGTWLRVMACEGNLWEIEGNRTEVGKITCFVRKTVSYGRPGAILHTVSRCSQTAKQVVRPRGYDGGGLNIAE